MSHYNQPASKVAVVKKVKAAPLSEEQKEIKVGAKVVNFLAVDHQGFDLMIGHDGTEYNTYALIDGKREEIASRKDLAAVIEASSAMILCSHAFNKTDGWCDECNMHKTRWEKINE